MKLNAHLITRRAGMTLIELTVVILVLLSLISIIFIAARAWRRSADRSANIMNIRNCQQAMRGEQNMNQMKSGDPFTREDLQKYMQYPTQINGTLGIYTNTGRITPQSANPAENWNHIWLIPNTPGLPGESYGHGDYAEVTGW